MKASDVKVGMVVKHAESTKLLKVIARIGTAGMFWASPFTNGRVLGNGDTMAYDAANLRPLTKREKGTQ